MKIRNAVIITDADSELSMRVDELPDFTGNVIFSRSKLPSDFSAAIDRAVGRSPQKDTVSSDLGGPFVNKELVG
jgi:hypothetical protein